MRAIFCQGHAHIFATYCRPKGKNLITIFFFSFSCINIFFSLIGIRVLIHPNSTKRSENVSVILNFKVQFSRELKIGVLIYVGSPRDFGPHRKGDVDLRLHRNTGLSVDRLFRETTSS